MFLHNIVKDAVVLSLDDGTVLDLLIVHQTTQVRIILGCDQLCLHTVCHGKIPLSNLSGVLDAVGSYAAYATVVWVDRAPDEVVARWVNDEFTVKRKRDGYLY